MAWSDDQKQQLRTLWDKGLSGNEIAKQMPEFSRNAIIGQAHRLRLPSRPSPIKRKRTPPDRLTTRPRECQWPEGHVGHPDFKFCRKKVKPGYPYCPGHCKRAYRRYEPKAEGEPITPGTPRRSFRRNRWTEGQINALKRHRAEGILTNAQIAKVVGHSLGSTQMKIRELGLAGPPGRHRKIKNSLTSACFPDSDTTA